MSPLLQVEHLSVAYRPVGQLWARRSAPFMALRDVSFSLQPGATLGVVGHSGSGKSTLAKALMRLVAPAQGRILFQGCDITALQGRALMPYRRAVQMIFQDPADSLNPKHTLAQILAEPLQIHRLSHRRDQLAQLLDRVGLPHDYLSRYPHELSGGQRQRLGIARALALQPQLIICDEPVSALDLSIQGQIINLLLDLQRQLSLSLIFISHDLRLVRHVSDDIAVMHAGSIVEQGPALQVCQHPQHTYTQQLLAHLGA